MGLRLVAGLDANIQKFFAAFFQKSSPCFLLPCVTVNADCYYFEVSRRPQPGAGNYRAPLGHSTTRSVCSRISRSNSTEKFFT